jgi:hypothetical protein
MRVVTPAYEAASTALLVFIALAVASGIGWVAWWVWAAWTDPRTEYQRGLDALGRCTRKANG